jgi:hypothetical protein
MSDARDLARIYGEKEIGRILKRATELQHDEPSAPARGMTLAELEEIGAEAGIDPRYLRRAALELDTGNADASIWTRVCGDELLLVRELTLEGELADDGFERIVEAIQTSSREHGQPSLLGRTLTWRAETSSKMRTIQIVVSSRDGQTQIRLEEDLTQTAMGWMAGLTAGGGIGLGMGVGMPIGIEVLGSAAFAIAFPLGTVAIAYIGARAVYRGIVKRRRSVVGALFDRVVEEARASIDAGRDALPPAST